MKIYFHNKGIEKVNLPQLMKKVKNALPSTFHYQDIPKIIYKRSLTISRKVFNYKDTVTNFDCKQWVNSPITCDCKTSEYCDPHHQHILTGNLGIVTDSKLRSLLCKGPKYREKERLNWDKVQTCINTGIEDCAKMWANYEKVDIKVMSEWCSTLKKLVKDKISQIIETKSLRGFGNPTCNKFLIGRS